MRPFAYHQRLSLWLTVLLFAPAALGADTAEHQQAKGKFLGSTATVYPDWFKESFLELGEDVDEATAAGKRIMVLFHQNGCPYCNALVERNLSQKSIETRLRENFDVVAINMWGDKPVLSADGQEYREKDFAAALKVQFTPTLIFMDEAGETVLRLNGYLPPQRFSRALDYVASKGEQRGSFRQYLGSNSWTNKGSGAMVSETFFSKPPYDLKQAIQDRPLALFFEQKDCPACESLHARPLTDPEVRDALKDFTVIQLDMWSDQPLTGIDGRVTTARQLAKSMNVNYAPSVLLLDQQGKEIIRNEAEFRIFHTLAIFDYVRLGGYRTQASFQRWLETRADEIREQGRDVNLLR